MARLRQRTAAPRSPQTFEDAPGQRGDGESCAIERLPDRFSLSRAADALIGARRRSRCWRSAAANSPRCRPRPAKPGITVVVRPGPATWFIGPNGQATGFDHDLLTRFARERGVPLNVVFADGAAALLRKIGSGEAQLGAGGLFQAASTASDERRVDPAAGVEHRLPRGRAGPDLQRRRLPAAPLGRSRQGDRRLPGAHRPRRATRRGARLRIRKCNGSRSTSRPPTR